MAAILAPQIAALARGFTHVFGPSTTFGKDLMPRVAALLDTAQVSDIMAVESATRFQSADLRRQRAAHGGCRRLRHDRRHSPHGLIRGGRGRRLGQHRSVAIER